MKHKKKKKDSRSDEVWRLFTKEWLTPSEIDKHLDIRKGSARRTIVQRWAREKNKAM